MVAQIEAQPGMRHIPVPRDAAHRVGIAIKRQIAETFPRVDSSLQQLQTDPGITQDERQKNSVLEMTAAYQRFNNILSALDEGRVEVVTDDNVINLFVLPEESKPHDYQPSFMPSPNDINAFRLALRHNVHTQATVIDGHLNRLTRKNQSPVVTEAQEVVGTTIRTLTKTVAEIEDEIKEESDAVASGTIFVAKQTQTAEA